MGCVLKIIYKNYCLVDGRNDTYVHLLESCDVQSFFKHFTLQVNVIPIFLNVIQLDDI